MDMLKKFRFPFLLALPLLIFSAVYAGCSLWPCVLPVIEGKEPRQCFIGCEVVMKTVHDPVALFTAVLSYFALLQFVWMTRQERVLSASVAAAQAAAEAAKEQARVAIKSQLPVVGWVDQKLLAYDASNKITDNPAAFGLPPTICRAEFCVKNGGPTKIIVVNYAIKLEIVSTQLASTPHYGRMAATAQLIDSGQPLWFAHKEELTSISAEQMAAIQRGHSNLWLYGFLTYLDYLEERHEIGYCFRWSVDPAVGFVPEGPPGYIFTRHEKTY